MTSCCAVPLPRDRTHFVRDKDTFGGLYTWDIVLFLIPAMQTPLSPFEVPDSDPYAPPANLPILLPRDSGTSNITQEQYEHDDIVPDSDPPYPAWLPLIVPVGWPGSASASLGAISSGPQQLREEPPARSEESTGTVQAGAATRDPPYEHESMIENVETLLSWAPSKPVFNAFRYTPSESNDVSPCESPLIGPQGKYMEEPTSDDEMEYRRGVETEMEMDRLLYGSPYIAVLSSNPVDIPIDHHGEEPTSDDEQAWRDQLEGEIARERVAECPGAENRTRQGTESRGTEEGSSPV